MECNKDEAIRAKDIATRKIMEMDYSGSRKFALKAQSLYPGLEGISQMLIALDVYIAAENRVYGEVDLYGILGVHPLADDETIKKEYRKLLLQLHPDKNKAVGADGAYIFVKEAFAVLSDKAKRSEYNTKRMLTPHRVPTATFTSVTIGPSVSRPAVPPPHSGVNGSRKHPTSTPASSSATPPSASATPPSAKSKKSGTQKKVQSFFKKGDTFWTVCARCKMQFEYMRMYLGQMLTCPNCKEGFLAVEVPAPSVMSVQLSNPSSNSKPRFAGSGRVNGNTCARWSPFSGTILHNNNINNNNNSASTSSKAKESLKRDRDEAHGANSDFVGPAKKMKKTNGGSSQPGIKNVDTGLANGYQGSNGKANVGKELTVAEAKKMVAKKALADIREKLSSWKLAEEKAKVKQIEKPKPKLEFNVPDPDFHVFDNDRLENCFKENQVWAAYDSDDGMPRFYAMIHEVANSNSSDGFMMKLSWLNSRSNPEFGDLDWVGRGFKKTCGDFWVGKHEANDLINSFSHIVKWEKGPRGVIQIYPREGEVWAVYKNWSPDWTLTTPDFVRHSYEMVEVVKGYNEDEGVFVAAMTKAPGFQTVYCMQPDPKILTRIPKEEMFRFSHQVPHHILTGDEKPNAPKGFVELDPAATPAHLLHVTVVDDQ